MSSWEWLMKYIYIGTRNSTLARQTTVTLQSKNRFKSLTIWFAHWCLNAMPYKSEISVLKIIQRTNKRYIEWEKSWIEKSMWDLATNTTQIFKCYVPVKQRVERTKKGKQQKNKNLSRESEGDGMYNLKYQFTNQNRKGVCKRDKNRE